jgi:tRNA threonylcarbamoyl adenosine modification protein YeaZ
VPASLVLCLETATRVSIAVLGRRGARGATAVSRREVQPREGSPLLEQVDEVLARAGTTLDEVAAVAVGTGPGSFTGLRVGLATAKTLAHVRGLPLVAVPTSAALRRAARLAGGPQDPAVVIPAGAHDHYLAQPGRDAEIVAPGGLADALGDGVAISLDGAVLGAEAARLGAQALERLPEALLELAWERLDEGAVDPPAELVPAYVALPRGAPAAAEELGWSPDLR